MLVAQRGLFALWTSEEVVADNQFATDGTELLLEGILNDNVASRRVTVADADGSSGGNSGGDAARSR
jgi:hypothetical protein